ncbi:hypothetical protein ACJMK2_028753, partial [Sinanodonta woodiana]
MSGPDGYKEQKFRLQSSRLPQSTPVSPDPRKKQINAMPPLPLWDKQKETAEIQENTSAKEKRDLSSKLKSPKLEEEPGMPLIPVTDQDTADGKSAESKRVTFQHSHGQESQNSGDVSTQHSTESKDEDELIGDIEQIPKPVTPAKVRQPTQPDTLQASTKKSQPVLSNSSNLGKTKPPET